MEEKEFNIPGLPKDTGFIAPERYFDQLPTRIMQRTAYAAPVGVTSPVVWFRQLKPILAGAAMVVVFVVSFIATNNLNNLHPATDTALANVSNNEIELYLLNQTEVEATDIAELASVTPPHSLEFIEVHHEDVSLDAAMELLEDNTESQALLYNEY